MTYRKGDIVKFKSKDAPKHLRPHFRVYDTTKGSVRDFYGGWWNNEMVTLVRKRKRKKGGGWL